MHCSAGSSLLCSNPWRTERILGLWTSWTRKRWDYIITTTYFKQRQYRSKEIFNALLNFVISIIVLLFRWRRQSRENKISMTYRDNVAKMLNVSHLHTGSCWQKEKAVKCVRMYQTPFKSQTDRRTDENTRLLLRPSVRSFILSFVSLSVVSVRGVRPMEERTVILHRNLRGIIKRDRPINTWNLVSWLSGKSLKFFPSEVTF